MSDVKDRIHEQVEFERSMADQHQPCESCWMLVELYDRLPAYEAAVKTLERLRTSIEMFVGEFESPQPGTTFREALRRLREGDPA